MPKLNLDSWIGKYSATPVSDEEAEKLQKQGHVVVEISDEQLAEWEAHVEQSIVWDKFWKKLSNEWLKEHHPELSL